MVSLGTTFNVSWASQISSSVYPPPHSIIVVASLSMYLAVRGDMGCCKILAADRWELVRLILLLLSLVCAYTVTGRLVVVQGVLMSIDDAWHANPAAPFNAALKNCLLDIHLATELSKTIKESELACQKYKYIAICRYWLVLISTDKYWIDRALCCTEPYLDPQEGWKNTLRQD